MEREIKKDLFGPIGKNKYNANANLISANEHDHAFKTIFVHKQTKIESKSFKGFNLMEEVTKEPIEVVLFKLKEKMDTSEKIDDKSDPDVEDKETTDVKVGKLDSEANKSNSKTVEITSKVGSEKANSKDSISSFRSLKF